MSTERAFGRMRLVATGEPRELQIPLHVENAHDELLRSQDPRVVVDSAKILGKFVVENGQNYPFELIEKYARTLYNTLNTTLSVEVARATAEALKICILSNDAVWIELAAEIAAHCAQELASERAAQSAHQLGRMRQPDSEVRHTLIQAIMGVDRYAVRDAAGVLIAVLTNEEEEEYVRTAAAEALGHVGPRPLYLDDEVFENTKTALSRYYGRAGPVADMVKSSLEKLGDWTIRSRGLFGILFE